MTYGLLQRQKPTTLSSDLISVHARYMHIHRLIMLHRSWHTTDHDNQTSRSVLARHPISTRMSWCSVARLNHINEELSEASWILSYEWVVQQQRGFIAEPILFPYGRALCCPCRSWHTWLLFFCSIALTLSCSLFLRLLSSFGFLLLSFFACLPAAFCAAFSLPRRSLLLFLLDTLQSVNCYLYCLLCLLLSLFHL